MPVPKTRKQPEEQKPETDPGPAVRLALPLTSGSDTGSRKAMNDALRPEVKEPPLVRLAHVPGAQGDNSLLGQRGVDQLPQSSWPALLVSFYYLKGFLERQKEYAYRDWMMDSGAFSAYNSGGEIDIHEYIDCCHKLRETDPTLAEIIALDVIGSGEGSLKNAWYMKEQGVEAMPVFHIGEDWQILQEYAKNWDKVGLSCRFGEPQKASYRFYDQCFARIWPKKTHSFGWVDEKMLMKYPFHSSDSSSWETGPCGFGNWKYFGKMSVKGSTQNLRSQVDWYLALEERLRFRWRREMALLHRFGQDASSGGGKRLLSAIGGSKEPTVRLSAGAEGSRDRIVKTLKRK